MSKNSKILVYVLTFLSSCALVFLLWGMKLDADFRRAHEAHAQDFIRALVDPGFSSEQIAALLFTHQPGNPSVQDIDKLRIQLLKFGRAVSITNLGFSGVVSNATGSNGVFSFIVSFEKKHLYATVKLASANEESIVVDFNLKSFSDVADAVEHNRKNGTN